MATNYGNIKGVQFVREPVSGGTGGLALISWETATAYTAASDNGQLGGGGSDGGVSTSDSLVTILQKRRRDGKTVNLRAVPCVMVETGSQGGTEFYAGTFAVSGSNVTFNIENQAGTEINAAAGVLDRPITIAVAFYLS